MQLTVFHCKAGGSHAWQAAPHFRAWWSHLPAEPSGGLRALFVDDREWAQLPLQGHSRSTCFSRITGAQKIAVGIGVECFPSLQAALGWTVALLVYVYNPSTREVKIREGTLDITGLANTTLADLALLLRSLCLAKTIRLHSYD